MTDLTTDSVIEYIFRDMSGGSFWIDFVVDGKPYGSMGPFTTEAARQAAADDITGMMLSMGAKDVPLRMQ